MAKRANDDPRPPPKSHEEEEEDVGSTLSGVIGTGSSLDFRLGVAVVVVVGALAEVPFRL